MASDFVDGLKFMFFIIFFCAILGTNFLAKGCNPYASMECPNIGYIPAKSTVISQTIVNHTCAECEVYSLNVCTKYEEPYICYDSFTTFKYKLKSSHKECTLQSAVNKVNISEAMDVLSKYQISETYYLFASKHHKDTCFEDWKVYNLWKVGFGLWCVVILFFLCCAGAAANDQYHKSSRHHHRGNNTPTIVSDEEQGVYMNELPHAPVDPSQPDPKTQVPYRIIETATDALPVNCSDDDSAVEPVTVIIQNDGAVATDNENRAATVATAV